MHQGLVGVLRFKNCVNLLYVKNHANNKLASNFIQTLLLITAFPTYIKYQTSSLNFHHLNFDHWSGNRRHPPPPLQNLWKACNWPHYRTEQWAILKGQVWVLGACEAPPKSALGGPSTTQDSPGSPQQHHKPEKPCTLNHCPAGKKQIGMGPQGQCLPSTVLSTTGTASRGLSIWQCSGSHECTSCPRVSGPKCRNHDSSSLTGSSLPQGTGRDPKDLVSIPQPLASLCWRKPKNQLNNKVYIKNHQNSVRTQ